MIRRKKQRNLGSRFLKLGMIGDDVGELQQRLLDMGYELGPRDNIFGYLTQEALQFFQRDYGLRMDGIAGQEVFAILQTENLPVTRRVHLVQAGESLDDVAALYNLSADALVRQHGKQIYPGQQLIFFDREVWGMLSAQGITQPEYHLTGIIVPHDPDGASASVTHVNTSGAKIAKVEFGLDDELLSIHNVLTKRKVRKKFLQFCKSLLADHDGIFLGWEAVLWIDGQRYLRLLKLLKKVCRKKRLIVMLSTTMPRWNLLGGIDFSAVSQVVDQVVVPVPSPEFEQALLDKTKIEIILKEILRYMPAYKVLLAIPVYSLMWNENDPISEIKISYQEAMRKIFRYGARLSKDDEGKRCYRFYSQGEQWSLQISTLEELNNALAVANYHNLAGVIIDSLGQEDQRFWTKLNNHFSIGNFS